MNSNCLLLYQFTPLKRTKNNELAVLDVYNLVIERYFYIISLQGKTNAISDLLIKNISKYYNLKL
jgi:hypothetical protein